MRREEKREQIMRGRQEQQMEQRIWDEMERTVGSLTNELRTIMEDLAASGVPARRLFDWETTALFAECLRPELAEEAKQAARSASQEAGVKNGRLAALARLSGTSDWFAKPGPPQALPQILGEQSQTLVCSDAPDDPDYYQPLAEPPLQNVKEAVSNVRSGSPQPVRRSQTAASGSGSGGSKIHSQAVKK